MVHVVPLLVESGDYARRVDRVARGGCAEEAQVARVGTRGAWQTSEVRSDHRGPGRARRAAAGRRRRDRQRGSLEALRKQVAALHEKYLKFASP